MSFFPRRTLLSTILLTTFSCPALPSQQPDQTSVIQHIDATVKTRIDSIAAYTDTEHYAVYRNNDEVHPAAEMTVRTVYRKESGKTYTIVSKSGSELIQRFVLNAILDNEKHVNEPGVREGSWITSANYQMTVKPGIQQVNGRDCLVVTLTPRRKENYLIQGTMWVDALDYSIVQIQGAGSKSASMFSGSTQMMRQYAPVKGFAEATHARASASSFMFGQTVITIDYSDYSIDLVPSK
jgi:hypothetical protein